MVIFSWMSPLLNQILAHERRDAVPPLSSIPTAACSARTAPGELILRRPRSPLLRTWPFSSLDAVQPLLLVLRNPPPESATSTFYHPENEGTQKKYE